MFPTKMSSKFSLIAKASSLSSSSSSSPSFDSEFIFCRLFLSSVTTTANNFSRIPTRFLRIFPESLGRKIHQRQILIFAYLTKCLELKSVSQSLSKILSLQNICLIIKTNCLFKHNFVFIFYLYVVILICEFDSCNMVFHGEDQVFFYMIKPE